MISRDPKNGLLGNHVRLLPDLKLLNKTDVKLVDVGVFVCGRLCRSFDPWSGVR